MYDYSRLIKAYEASHKLEIDDNTRIIFFSDCHRGDFSKADNFAPNRAIYETALQHYYAQGYTYIEIGDGDELWENDNLSVIIRTHRETFRLLQRFHNEGRFYMLYGNHDIFKRYPLYQKKKLHQYYDPESRKTEPLLDGLHPCEGLLLQYKGTPLNILVIHGHQGDLLNDRLWPLARFLVRYVWRNFEHLRNRDPISPARSVSRMLSVESGLLQWVRANRQMVIAGHTHHTAFAYPGDTPYFNDGCCVYKGYITGIEIQNGEIALVKWSDASREGGSPAIRKEILEGPVKIRDFIEKMR